MKFCLLFLFSLPLMAGPDPKACLMRSLRLTQYLKMKSAFESTASGPDSKFVFRDAEGKVDETKLPLLSDAVSPHDICRTLSAEFKDQWSDSQKTKNKLIGRIADELKAGGKIPASYLDAFEATSEGQLSGAEVCKKIDAQLEKETNNVLSGGGGVASSCTQALKGTVTEWLSYESERTDPVEACIAMAPSFRRLRRGQKDCNDALESSKKPGEEISRDAEVPSHNTGTVPPIKTRDQRVKEEIERSYKSATPQ